MNTDTGEIRNFKEKDILEMLPKERKQWVSLSTEQNQLLSGMNREQRRAYYKKNKKQFGGLSWQEVNGTNQ